MLAQTYQSWELIIVNDGSTDNTEEVVKFFGDSRIKYIYQKNSERSVARNNGIGQSNGQYICFLDSDDYYLDNYLENLHQAIVAGKFPKAVFITDVVRDENGVIRNVAHEKIEKHLNSVCYILCSTETVIPARVCIQVEIFKEYQFNTQLNVSEDSELLTRIAVKYPFIQVPFHTVVYHLHDDNTTNRTKNPYAGQLVALKMIFGNPDLKPFIPRIIKNQKLSKCYYGIAQYYQYKEEYWRMTWALIKSLALDPLSDMSKAKLYLIIKYFPTAFC